MPHAKEPSDSAFDLGSFQVDRLAVHAQWLLRLRWVAVVGQLATVAVAAWLFSVRLPWQGLLAVIGATAATNLAAWLWWRRFSEAESRRFLRSHGESAILLLVAFDLFSLTALLYLAGGPANPFAIFYFVNLALAAVILTPRRVWLLTAVAVVGWAVLFLDCVPLPELNEAAALAGAWTAWRVPLKQQGLFVALAGGSTVVVYFITRVTLELRRRETQLREAEQRRARGQRLEALATLAAGAGHELATPLSTIAVIAGELSHHLEGTDAPVSVMEDVKLIRSELDHCRGILDRLAAGAGQAVGEQVASVTVEQLVEETLSALRRRSRVSATIHGDVRGRRLDAPLQGLAQALRGIVQNALDASEPDGPVELHVSHAARKLQLEVRDRGPGMNAETLARAGDPFFTTKQPGQGMGLGLFLARSVIERLDGTLELHSRPGRGATARIRLPLKQGGQKPTTQED